MQVPWNFGRSLARGVLDKSNAERVEKAVRLARDLRREMATTEEVRKVLNIKEKGLETPHR
jgi:3-keto-5-aminohexanoate cleavage enzyme